MQDRISYQQISGTIGSMIWLWSEIERALAKAIRDLGDVPPHGIGQRLTCWAGLVRSGAHERAKQDAICLRLVGMLRESLRMRNAIVHGLIGINAQTDDAPACLTVWLNGRTEAFDWEMLQAMFGWMSQTAWLIEALTEAAQGGDPAKLAGWASFTDKN